MSCIPDFEKCLKIFRYTNKMYSLLSFIILPNKNRKNVILKIVTSLNIKQSFLL